MYSIIFGLFRNKVKVMQVKYVQRYKWLKLTIFVNMIILQKATMSGISYISTHIFVNINYIIEHEASIFF